MLLAGQRHCTAHTGLSWILNLIVTLNSLTLCLSTSHRKPEVNEASGLFSLVGISAFCQFSALGHRKDSRLVKSCASFTQKSSCRTAGPTGPTENRLNQITQNPTGYDTRWYVDVRSKYDERASLIQRILLVQCTKRTRKDKEETKNKNRIARKDVLDDSP